MKFLSSALFLALSISSTTTTQAFTVVTPSRRSHKNAISTSTASSVSNTIKPSKVYNTRSSAATLTTLHAEPTKITMPALSSTMKEGRVVSWLKNEGDEVSAGEAIMVVESDKADMDVEAFEDGFIAKILVGEGESAPVGNVVALMVEEESDIAAVAAAGDGVEAASSGEAAPAPASGESFNDDDDDDDNVIVEVVSDEKNQSSNNISRSNNNNNNSNSSSNNKNNSNDNIHLEASIEMTEIFMPALSSTMVEGKIVSWLKDVGDAVSAGEAIMVVESDKADMDVEAFEDGYLAVILKQEGEMVDVGAPVGIIVSALEDVSKVVVSDASTRFDSSSTTSTTTTITTTTASSNSSSTGSSNNSSTNPPLDDAPAASAATTASAPDCDFSQVDMPALSSTMKEGKVVSWLKAEGDPISAGEAIMVVESDKADMDVEAFEDGFLAAIITAEGDSCTVGAPVALIASEEKDIPALQAYAASLSGAPVPAASAPPVATVATPVAAAAPTAPKAAAPKAASGSRIVASPLAKTLAEEKGVDLSTVVGTGPEGRITAGDVEKAAAGGAPAKKAAAAPAKPAWTPAAGVIAATPMARAAAKKAKIDLSTIQGTGEFGRVTLDDVKIATGEKKPVRKQSSKGAAAPVELPSGLVPFTGMQRAVAKNMDATLTTPVFRVSREIEMDEFDALYLKVKSKGITVSALLAKAAALALEKYPIINSSYTPEGTVFNPDINIAMAVAIDGGLITPTLKYANERNIMDLGENWKELVQKAKDGKLTPDEYSSGTFTISNLGMFGVSQFDAILPSGMGGILAIGGTQECIVPCNKAVLGMKKIKKMTVTLTADHRQIYGADAALFLKEFNAIMTNPSVLLL